MCNINIIIKKGITDNEKLLNMFSSATYNSYSTNDDGDGIYFNHGDVLTTSEEKINVYNYKEEFFNSNYIISHQRLTTSGVQQHNIQPFKNDGFIMCHNGVLSSFVKQNTNSDSLNLFDDIIKSYNESKQENRTKKIIEAIQKNLNGVSGSYSIALFDQKNNELYYFKNNSTSIHFIKSKSEECLFITTSYQNKAYFDVYNKKNKDYIIKDHMIYKIRINKKNKVVITEEAKIKPSTVISYPYYVKTDGYNSLNNYNYNAYGSIPKRKTDVILKPKKQESNIINNLIEENDYLLNELVYSNDLKESLKLFKDTYKITKNTHLRTCSNTNCRNDTYNTAGIMSVVLCDECLTEEIKSFHNLGI